MLMDEHIEHYELKLAFETGSWDLKVALESGGNVVVIDARSSGAYQKEHFQGSINIPHRHMNEEKAKNLDKTALVVTYCDGIGCNASAKGGSKHVEAWFSC